MTALQIVPPPDAPPIELEPQPLSPTSRTWRTLVAGGVAGCTAKTCVAPIDRVKILFQTDAPSFRHLQGSLRGAYIASQQIYSSNGARGLFQGHTATMMRIFPYAAIKYLAFEQFSRVLTPTREQKTPFRHFLVGSFAGIAAIFGTYPLELIRVRSAYSTNATSLIHVASSIGQENLTGRFLGRVPNYYRGFMPTLYGVIPYAGTTFLVYEEVKQVLLDRSHRKEWVPLIAGGLAGAVAQTVTYPLEIVRRQMQVNRQSAENSATTFGTFRNVFQRAGVRGFFVGLSLGYVKMIPMTMASFWTYESCKRWLKI